MKLFAPIVAAVFAVTLGAASSARAETVVGIGAQAMLTGPAGASVTVDFQPLHVDGIVFFSTIGDDSFGGAVRLWYAVHQTERSDLSVGGGFGFFTEEDNNVNNNNDESYHLEGGAKIRAFLTPNVAISGMLGLSVVIVDGPGDGVVGDGQALNGGNFNNFGFLGGFGITYFFD